MRSSRSRPVSSVGSDLPMYGGLLSSMEKLRSNTWLASKISQSRVPLRQTTTRAATVAFCALSQPSQEYALVLIDIGKNRLGFRFFAEIRQQEQKPGQAFLARVEKLIDQIFFISRGPGQQMISEAGFSALTVAMHRDWSVRHCSPKRSRAKTVPPFSSLMTERDF